MFTRKSIIIQLAVLIIFAQGCAAVQLKNTLISQRDYECGKLFKYLDESVQTSGVKDTSNFRVPHFPYLRANRFLVSLGDRLDSEEDRKLWIGLMREIAFLDRQKEIENLSELNILKLNGQFPGIYDRETLSKKVTDCSHQLLQTEEVYKDYYKIVQASIKSKREYSLLMRMIGFYPLTSIHVTFAAQRARNKFKKWYDAPLESLPVKGELTVYSPTLSVPFVEKDILSILVRSTQNALGIPILLEEEQKILVETFAPVFFQDVGDYYDKFGEVIWDGDRVDVNTSNPAVYYYITRAFFKNEPILQINYVLWFSDREGPNAPWMERGHIDGMTIRVSLDTEGIPFMADIMNNCGCYHFFVPRKERTLKVISQPGKLPPFIPQWLPEEFPRKRLGIRINSGWHQVQRLIAIEPQTGEINYQLKSYDTLEKLALPEGGTKSIFDDNGIIASSHRIEPLFLFSMGVPKVGSMRQRGHHAIELVGEEHFDDPGLFDKNFIFK